MRTIQFRAWDASEKEMVDWPHLLNDPDDWLLSLLNDPGEDVLMQFIGRKDAYDQDLMREMLLILLFERASKAKTRFARIVAW